MTDPKTCRNCKHWCSGTSYPNAREWDSAMPCDKLKKHLDIEIDQGSGWDCGGATIEEVGTPPDFGCNLFEEFINETKKDES